MTADVILSDDDSDSEVSRQSISSDKNTDVLFDLQESNSSQTKTKIHVPLSTSLNILIIVLSICVLIVGIVAIYFLFDIINDNSEVSARFHVKLDARNTAADVTLVDRDVSAAIQLFTAFGDDHFLLNFFDLINSGRRQTALTNLLSLELTENQLLSISQVGTFANVIRRLEFISGRLICSVFEVDESLCSRFNDFTYDSQLESNYFRDKLTYDDVVWYSTLEQDLEKSVNDRLNIARNAQFNSRWTAIFMTLLHTLEGTAITIIDSLFEFIEAVYNNVSSDFNLIWISAITTSIIILIIMSIAILNRRSLRFAGFLVFIFLIVFVVIISTAVYFSITAESIFTRDISTLIVESRRVFARVVNVEWEFNFRRRFDQLAFSNNFEHFELGEISYQTLLEHVDSLSSTDFVSHPALDNAIESINRQLNLIEDRLMDYIERVQIMSKLATFYLPEYQLSSLVNITWDIDQLPLSERHTWNLPHGYSLTNSETDLTNSDEYLKNVSRAILTSKYFYTLSRDLVESFAEIRRSTTNTLIDIVDPFDAKFVFNLEIAAYLVVALLVATVLCCFFIILSGRKERPKASHVKQKISFPAMNNYTKQYVLSLAILFVILSLFYIGSLIGFTQLRPLPRLIQDYGTRTALVTRIANDVISAFIQPEQQIYYLNNAQIRIRDLLHLHHSLVVNHVDADFHQTKLLFDSKYDDTTRSFSDLDDNHGLHSLIINYINFAELFAIQDSSLDYSNSSPDLVNLLVYFDSIAEMSLESIDNLHTFSINRIAFFSTYVLVVFIAFIVVLSISYIFVFRKMLKDLHEEEFLILEFLEMIPEDILTQEGGIQNFFATKG
ncbi:hypothetical protein GEMRC1_009365 [Eukaryota sp. GEM-RC1]